VDEWALRLPWAASSLGMKLRVINTVFEFMIYKREWYQPHSLCKQTNEHADPMMKQYVQQPTCDWLGICSNLLNAIMVGLLFLNLADRNGETIFEYLCQLSTTSTVT
jgi:hypothetical protein